LEDQKKLYLFEEAPIAKAVVSMCVPTIISSLVMVIYNLADTYFVGMLNNPIQNAAVTLAAPVLLAFNAVNNLFGVGSSSLMSRSLGRKEYDTVRRVSAFGFYGSVAGGLVFTVIMLTAKGPVLTLLGTDAGTAEATGAYLHWTVTCGAVPAILNVVMAYMVRSEGSTLHASVGTMSGCLLNIVLDPIFILPWGLDMGAAGAGLATFLSNCAACVYFFVLLAVRGQKTYVCIRPSMFPWDKRIAKGVCAVGIPAAIQNLLNVTGMTVLNNFTSAFGADAVAAMGISQKVNMVPVNVAFGVSQGVMPLVGYNYASGNAKRMREAIGFAARVSVSFLTAVALCYFFGAEWFIGLFIKNETIIAYGARFLHGMCLALPFLNVDFMAVGVFQAAGMGRRAFAFAVLRKIVMEIPALYILNALFPLYGLAYAQAVTEVILAAAAVVMLRKLFREADSAGRGAA